MQPLHLETEAAHVAATWVLRGGTAGEPLAIPYGNRPKDFAISVRGSAAVSLQDEHGREITARVQRRAFAFNPIPDGAMSITPRATGNGTALVQIRLH